MGTGRDNFAESTKRKAAGRVGYRCSFPNCHNATIGASLENTNKTSITGVAAHICAAAEEGPRYDPNMSVEERKSVENCIWLCQTHSKLIDTDVATYTVDKLRQWKANAELAASKALANGDFFSEFYKGSGDNLDILQQLFDDMIIEGQYSQLRTMLDQYKTSLSEQYEEFVLRYNIIYDVYCDRSKLNGHLAKYCSLDCKNGVDILVKLFLTFHLKEELSRIIDLSTSEELKKYAELAIKDELTSLFIAPVGSANAIEIPTELKGIISKYIANYIIQSRIVGAVDVTGAKYEVFSDEFYYCAIKAAYELACASVYGKGNFEDVITGSDFLFIKDNIDKIITLDASLQEYIWAHFLGFLSEKPEEFETYYELCPKPLKGEPSIERARYICRINCDVGSIECDELLEYVSISGDHAILCMYLYCIEKNDAINFLDEHGYLLKKDSIYLNLRLDLLSDIKPEEVRIFLERYRGVYEDDFRFHLLMAKYTDVDHELLEELMWLKLNHEKMSPYDVIDYIRILRQYQCWDDLVELSQVPLPNGCAFILANYLSESEDIKHVKVSLNLYQGLIEKEWKQRGLFYNKGIVHWKVGDFEKAKESLCVEYDEYANISALHALIQLRNDLNQYEIDCYFDQLKRCVDANSQNAVAAVYLKCGNYSDARKYFLRSLLLKDSDNPSINGFCLAVSHLPSKDASAIEENVFCVLKNSTGEKYIAIHEADVLEGIEAPNTFANYMHYSAHDVRVSSLLFASQGESILWNDQEYTVTEIMSANDAIKRYFFSTLSDQEGVTVITSSSGEDFTEQILAILQESLEHLNEHIDRYNQLEVRPPLSMFAAATGKGRLKTCEFLAFENHEKIRNNASVAINVSDVTTFVLSYDAIVYLTHLGVETALLNQLDLMCSLHVKNQLINDINEELSALMDESQKGTMFIEDGKLALLERTPEMRRTRYSFLTRLKSFVESLRVTNNVPAFSSDNDELRDRMENLFLDKQLYCESASLATTKHTPDAALVTDDQFLSAMATVEGMPTIGLTGLLFKSNLPWERLLFASKKLKVMNYGNYLPVHLYKRIVDQMLDSGSENDVGSAEIQAWILSDTEGDATPYHEDIVIALHREVVERSFDYLNPDSFLTRIVLDVQEKRNPGFIKRILSNAFGSLLTTEQEADSHELSE